MSENNSYNQPQYQGQQTTGASSYEEAISVKEWLLTYLIMLVPCVNIIMVFVWAFSSSEKKSKANFFKAMLIVYAIVICIYIVVFAIFGAAIIAAVSNS